MNITIRKATVDDKAEITRLNKALFDYEDQFNHDYNLDWPYSDVGQKYFTRSLTDETYAAFVAVSERKIVGYIIAFTTTYAYRSINPICEIDNMFVEEAFRSQGIGRQLIDAVKSAAKEMGAKRLRVGAIAQNTQAISFYERNGFGKMNTYLETKIL